MTRSAIRGLFLPTMLAGLALTMTVTVPTASAATSTWANAAGGNWSNAANWSPAGVPATGDGIVLPALGGPYVVTVDANPSIGALTLASGATLRLAANDSLRFTGTLIQNDGSIEVGSNLANCLFFADSVHVRGTGEVVLAGQARINNIMPKPQAPQRVYIVNEAGHTIRGSGDIWMPIRNHGLLHADATGGTILRMSERLENWGTVRASHATFHMNVPAFRSHGGQIVGNGGQFTTIIGLVGNVGGTIDNLDGGSFVADGGDLYVAGGTIAKGTITHTANGGAVHFNYLGNPSDIIVAPGATLVIDGQYDWTVNNSKLENHGTVVVTGLLNVFCQSSAVCDLTGDGTLVLRGGTIASGALGGSLHNSAGSTITGCGTITANVINDGTISIDCATGATTITDVTITNRKNLQVVRGSLRLRGTKARLMNTGTVTLSGLSYIDQGATVWNHSGGRLVSNGTAALGGRAPGATIIGGTLSGSGTFLNCGTVTLNGLTLASDATFTTGAATTTRVSGATVTNAGTNDIQGGSFIVDAGIGFVQSGGLTRLSGGTLTVPSGFTVNGALRGTGTVVGNVINAGEVTPDVNANGLRIQGDYHQLAAGRLDLGLAGFAVDQFAHLTVTGAAQLHGILGVTNTGGFAPVSGAFGVMGAGSVAGQFTTVEPAPGLMVQPLYEVGGVKLQAASAVSVDGPVLPAVLSFRGLGRTFALELPKAAEVSVRAYDVSGRMVAVLASGPLAAGSHRFATTTAGLPSGLYFAIATVVADGRSEVRRARTVVIR